jgi:hypothetical protein
MKMDRGSLKALSRELIHKIAANSRVRLMTISILVALFVLQLYFVRELLAAELLFGLAFGALLAIGALFYVLGAVGERGFDLTEAGVRVMAVSARRGFATLEEMSRKAMRPPRSESAQ